MTVMVLAIGESQACGLNRMIQVVLGYQDWKKSKKNNTMSNVSSMTFVTGH